MTNIEQGVIAAHLHGEGWSWKSLQCMFGRGTAYIKGRINDALNVDEKKEELEELAKKRKRNDEEKKQQTKET